VKQRKTIKPELIGHVGVDSGTIMVGDPCYHLHKTPTSLDRDGFGRSWEEFCNSHDHARNFHTIGNDFAIWIGGFGGDGHFPVYARRDKKGRVTQITIKFK
jgi:hypothetical protein